MQGRGAGHVTSTLQETGTGHTGSAVCSGRRASNFQPCVIRFSFSSVPDGCARCMETSLRVDGDFLGFAPLPRVCPTARLCTKGPNPQLMSIGVPPLKATGLKRCGVRRGALVQAGMLCGAKGLASAWAGAVQWG